MRKNFNKTRFSELCEKGEIYNALATGEAEQWNEFIAQSEEMALTRQDIEILGGSAFHYNDPELDSQPEAPRPGGFS